MFLLIPKFIRSVSIAVTLHATYRVSCGYSNNSTLCPDHHHVRTASHDKQVAIFDPSLFCVGSCVCVCVDCMHACSRSKIRSKNENMMYSYSKRSKIIDQSVCLVVSCLVISWQNYEYIGIDRRVGRKSVSTDHRMARSMDARHGGLLIKEKRCIQFLRVPSRESILGEITFWN